MPNPNTPCTAFEGRQQIATGPLIDVALAAKRAVDRTAEAATPPVVLVFDDASAEVIELDWRGSESAYLSRLSLRLADTPVFDAAPASDVTQPANDTRRGPGRPRLGVVAREVTLLPRHWDWLASQSGGASVALRKLVETARRASETSDRVKQARAVGYRFMSTMAGQESGFEEASRALFAGDRAAFEARTAHWPADIRAHLLRLLADGLERLEAPAAESTIAA